MVDVLIEHDHMTKGPNIAHLQERDITEEIVQTIDSLDEGASKDVQLDLDVKIMDKDNVVLRNRKDVKRIRRCRVIFSYKQDHEDELNLNVGDVIDILGEEEEGWWRGLLNGKTGVFPSNFVEEIMPKLVSSKEDLTNIPTDNDEPLALPPKPSKIICEVKFHYKAQNDDELTLNEGDIVTVLSKDCQDQGWWKGELNGSVGVFPDNFVVILPYDDKTKEEKKAQKAGQDPQAGKPSSIAMQRKSLESKSDSESKIPPVPKKPTAIKKSPSATSATGGIFSGIKKKIADAVDGATSSKNLQAVLPALKTENCTDNHSDNVFDQVERTGLLSDVRATRVKAPAGRRPPSVVFREDDAGIPNGTSEHPHLEMLAENTNSTTNTSETTDGAPVEVKPKLREWEKHKAPWLAEMKLSQAKRTIPSETKRTSIPSANDSKLKLTTPTEKAETEEVNKSPSKVEKENVTAIPSSPPPVDMSKSMPALSTKLKTPPNEIEKPIRIKHSPSTPTRPHSIQSISVSSSDIPQKPPTHNKTPLTTRTPSPLPKVEKTTEVAPSKVFVEVDAGVTAKQFNDLLERVQKLETLVEKQSATIEELANKLQTETELRQMLQVQIQRVNPENELQV